MSSISKIASSTLAVAAVLFMHGASAAAIPGDASTVDAETPSGPASHDTRPEIDPAVLEQIFGPPPTTDAEKYKVNKNFQEYLEQIFGKPPSEGQESELPTAGADANEEDPTDVDDSGIANRPADGDDFEIANRPADGDE